MITIQEILLPESATAHEALAALDRTGNRFLFIVDHQERLVGLLTDGDIRRGFLRGLDVRGPVTAFMQREFVSLPVEATDREIGATLAGPITFLPLLDAQGRPVDYASQQRHRRYPVAQPFLEGNEEAYITECVRTGWISSQGRFVGEFERMLGEFHGTEPAVAVANGTVALQLALAALGIGSGDEVIVPTLTFAATASAVVHAGATPVFADVDPETWVIGARQIEAARTAKTRAVIPVHLYGYPCPMLEICNLAHRHGFYVIEDTAEAFGATVGGRVVGSFGDAASFSFFGNKTLTTGEGGALLFRDSAVRQRARILRDHGMSPERRYWHLEPGFNYRMTNLQAAVGVAQMERVDDILKRKQRIFEFYTSEFSGRKEFVLQRTCEEGRPSCWIYTLLLATGAGMCRDELSSRLLRNGIETRPMFYPLHSMPAFSRYAGQAFFPVAESLAPRGLSFPSAVTLTESSLENICAVTRSILEMRQMVNAS